MSASKPSSDELALTWKQEFHRLPMHCLLGVVMDKVSDIMHQKVLSEIARLTHNGSESIVFTYRYGLCFKFYLQLKQRFHCAKALYDSDHVIIHLFGRYYDCTGEVQRDRHIDMIEHYPDLYRLWFKRYS